MKALDPSSVVLEGSTLIEASAGTGKTYTIATLFLRLLLEQQLEVSEILVVTYTRAATAELRDRIRRRLLEAIAWLTAPDASHDPTLMRMLAARAESERGRDLRALERAVRDFDQASIFTIHGFCQRTLSEHAFDSRTAFELELVEQQAPLLQEIAQDYWATIAYRAESAMVGALRARKVDPETLERLAAKTVQDTRMPVLPALPAPSAIALERFEALRARACELFGKGRVPIEAELCQDGRLHRGSYNPDTIRSKWLPALDALGAATPSTLPKFLKALTPNELAAKLNKSYSKFGAAAPTHPFFAAVAELLACADALGKALDENVLGARQGLVGYAREESAIRRRARGVQSFDELLEQLERALSGERGPELARSIAERHPAALIDEFQDTDPLQYGIFRRLYARPGTSLFLIGDPKQAIYGFRGADVFAYMQAARDGASAACTLDVNYRSDPPLLRALNSLFGRARRPFLLGEIGYERVRPAPAARTRLQPETPALQLLFVPRDERTGVYQNAVTVTWAEARLPRLIAGEISALLASGTSIDGRPVEPRDIAVLCRTNAQARNVQRELAALRVPTVLDGDNSVFESDTAVELAHVLWAIAQPGDSRRHGAALASAILGVSGAEIARMRGDEAGLEPWLERFTRLNQLWHERSFITMLHALLAETNAHASLLARPDGERRLTDLLHLAELLHGAAAREHLGPLSLLAWYGRMREDPLARDFATESAQIRLEHDERALKLTTIHRSKGLEFPIVFCPFACLGRFGHDDPEVRFHDHADGDRLKLDLGSSDFDAHKRAAEREDQAESLRLLYVALTRARHRCYAVCGRFTRGGTSSLAYLLHQPPGDDAPTCEAVDARIATLDDAALREEIARLCEAAENTIGLREISFANPVSYAASEAAPATLECRVAARVHGSAPRMSSFSRWAARSESAGEEPGADRDQSDEYGAALGMIEPRSELPALALADFPTGTRVGTLIHSVYERIDFRRCDQAELARETERSMRAYGLDPAQHAATLARAIASSLETPLDHGDPPLCLGALAPEARLNELEFTLSTPHAAAALSPSALADVFERHAGPNITVDYPERLRALPALPATGFWKGFIDLVFRAGERFYVVDYKSNWLGRSAHDYVPAKLAAVMSEHHYYLQYHLYALALHRQLALRVADYDYARHFGGVYYLFVRGMAKEHARGTGVFFDRPALLLLEALAAALGAGGTREEPA